MIAGMEKGVIIDKRRKDKGRVVCLGGSY